MCCLPARRRRRRRVEARAPHARRAYNNGFSLAALYRAVESVQHDARRCILLVRTTASVLLGAFLSDLPLPPKKDGLFFGDTDCFVFVLRPLRVRCVRAAALVARRGPLCC